LKTEVVIYVANALSLLPVVLFIRGRPNFVFFFVFGAEKRIFLFFGLLFFWPKKVHTFSVYFIFRYKYGRKNNRKQWVL